MANQWLFTSESVTEGHPDKLCDQIADGILDALLSVDPKARVACEVMTTTGLVVVIGEMTTSASIDIPNIVRQTIRSAGYTDSKLGFDANTCAVITAIDEQSPDIALGVNQSLEHKEEASDEALQLGAGDQGMMFGYANTDTPELMPLPIALAHALTQRLALVRKDQVLPFVRPDGKAQVTVAYQGQKPAFIDTVVLSTQHDPDVDPDQLEQALVEQVIRPVLPVNLLQPQTRLLINPTGRFVIGGPQGDSGLSGRKIIVDTYGGFARHGGGSFSGKDPTKVDRSGAYAARYVAKNIVAAGLASACEIQLAYAIGVAQPVSLMVETFGTETIDRDRIGALVRKHVDLRPSAIIRHFNLRTPIYQQLATYGHFGRPDLDLPWEQTDLAAHLKADATAT